MSAYLVSSDTARRNYLVHYRKGGEKKGVRRWQNEDGSYTKAGYEHYKEMYGWGEKREAKKDEEAKKADSSGQKSESSKPSMLERKIQKVEQKAERNKAETRKEAKETDKQVAEKVEKAVDKINDANTDEKVRKLLKEASGADFDGVTDPALENKIREATKSPKNNISRDVQSTIREIRGMSDEELNKQLDRLRREKQYADLVKEQHEREKSPLRQTADKLIKQAAEDLGRKSLALAVDTIIGKAKSKLDEKVFKLSDYKDVDIYSLDSDKIKAISQAFQDAANLSRNRWTIEHPNNNDGNNGGQKKDNDGNNGGQKKSNEPANQNAGEQSLSKNQRKRMRSMASSGKSAAEIAKEFGVSESTVRQYAGEQLKEESQKKTDSEPAPAAPSKEKYKPKASTVRDLMTNASDTRKKSFDDYSSTLQKSQKAMDLVSKAGKKISDENDRQKRLNDYIDRLNGSEWEKQKAKIREEDAQRQRERDEEERKRRLRLARNGLITR